MADNRDELESRSYPIREDMTLQQRLWKTERVGWYLILLILVLALAGLFSTGPLSRVNAQTPSGQLAVDYQRFERLGASSDMRLTIRGSPGETLWLTLDGALLERFALESIQPEPALAEGAGSGMRLQLTLGGDSATLNLTLRPNGVGPARSRAQLRGETLDISQFVYP
ncbi:hypothetical protein [Stutzerimonas azotifigens]|uniref:hypothetical protein n=1 Tax=Stutzerimonas azotifigens TaxID=291995 RepID=UPI0003F81702|nr:hypothetical protein [Stutzerimonas azotifigens]